MTAVNILLAVLGGVITITVVAGMVLLTPRGSEVHAQTPESQLGPREDSGIDHEPAVTSRG